MYRATRILQLGRVGCNVARRRGLSLSATVRPVSACRTLKWSGGMSTGLVGAGKMLPSTCSPSSSLLYLFRGYADFPKHREVKLPALSPTMETGTLVAWEKEEGDELSDGDVLAQVETDKATMDMETPRSGYLAKIVIPNGTKDIPLGKIVCIIVEKEEDVAAFKDYQPPDGDVSAAAPSTASPDPQLSQPPSPTAPPPSQPAPVAQPPSTTGAAGRIFASPFAKTLAAGQGIDLQTVQGSGPGGRIVSGDLSQAPVSGVSTPSYTDIQLTNMRKTIAKRLQESKQTIPHYYLTTDVVMEDVLSLRKQFNEESNGEFKLSVNDFIIKASALAMKKVPEVNSSWFDTYIRQYNNVDVSVAVSTDGGLITPIVFGADVKGLRAISANVAELAEKARSNKLQPQEFQGGTFTISNLGMFGVKQFTAVINPPQSCILAVGATEKRVIEDKTTNRGSRLSDVMTVTLSCDHRVVDGAVGAQWLKAFKSLLEKPHTMLL